MLSALVLRDALISALRSLPLEQDGKTTYPFAQANTAYMEAVLGAIAEAVVGHIQSSALVTGTGAVTGTAGPNPVVGTCVLNPDTRIV